MKENYQAEKYSPEELDKKMKLQYPKEDHLNSSDNSSLTDEGLAEKMFSMP